LFQDVASKTNIPEIYEILWTASRKICKSDNEFLQYLQEQKLLFNVFKNVLNFKTVDIIEFTIKELQEIATNNQIRDILRQQDHKSQNLLQQSVVYRKPLEFYEHLFKVYHAYFKLHEILDIINNNDDSENNLLFNVVRYKNKEIINHTWNQIQNILKNDKNYKKLKKIKNFFKKLKKFEIKLKNFEKKLKKFEKVKT